MRKILILILMGLPLLLAAQRYPTGKGTYRSGGGGSYTQTDKGDYNSYKLTITPRLGYFLTDQILVGFQTNLSLSYDTVYTSGIKITPQVKYYYTLNKSWFLLATAEYGLDRTTKYYKEKSVDDHSSLSVGPGVAYFYSRRIGFEVNALYQAYFIQDDSHTNRLVAQGGVVFNILSKKDRNKKTRERTYEPNEDDDE